jgi:hypothetical protein
VKDFTPILPLKDEAEFTWGAEQQVAFSKINEYLSMLSVLKALRSGAPFRLYVATKDNVIGVVLTQVIEGKGHIITYVSQQLLDAETRYHFIKKICFVLHYACTKLRHYLVCSTCTITCQTDVIKHMLYRPILSGKLGKWAYSSLSRICRRVAHLCIKKKKNGPLQTSPPHSGPGHEGLRVTIDVATLRKL